MLYYKMRFSNLFSNLYEVVLLSITDFIIRFMEKLSLFGYPIDS